MVVESLFNPFSLKRKPLHMFLGGFIYAIVGLFLAYFVFKEISGILMVFLIVLATLPTIYVTIKNEEELDLKIDKEWKLLKEHTKVILYLMALFFGITSALVISYVFLPQPIIDSVFDLQERAITNVNQEIQESVTGNITKIDLFGKIFLNNLKVLFFCLLFSLLYGTGAIFILTWNASVIAAAMGSFIKTEIAKTAALVGFGSLSAYFSAATFSFFRYMTHGLVEIAAYFVAGLAGGIISIALIKHNLKEDRILIDSLYLIIISLGLLFFAGLVEVYITPILLT